MVVGDVKEETRLLIDGWVGGGEGEGGAASATLVSRCSTNLVLLAGFIHSLPLQRRHILNGLRFLWAELVFLPFSTTRAGGTTIWLLSRGGSERIRAFPRAETSSQVKLSRTFFFASWSQRLGH